MSSIDAELVRGLLAIEPYLDQVVVAGGWVPHIYQQLVDESPTEWPPRTRDIDFAVPRELPLRSQPVDELLEAAGFECGFYSLDTPPVTKYVAKGESGLEIEFITDAPGANEGVRRVQPKLTAQELRYVGLLLDYTWSVTLSSPSGDLEVRVPSPAAFVLHKALTYRRRREGVRREKDLYYIFFVVASFPGWRKAMEDELAGIAARRPSWFRRALEDLTAIFESPDADGVVALLNQRPSTSYPGLADDQFCQYAYSVMSELVAIMRRAARDQP